MKLIHTSDWHFGMALGTGSYKYDQRHFLQQLYDLIEMEKVEAVLLAGDLFDGEASRGALDLLKRELENCGVPVLIAPGNHDFCHPDSIWVQERWPENVFIFTEGLESVTIQGLNCRIYGAAFRSMDCTPLLEGFQAEGTEKYRIAVLHGDPTQSSSPCNPITASQVRNSGLQYIALGHIHKAGAFQAGRTLCAWPGCPMGRGWDETGEKGVCIVTLTDTVDIQAVSLDTLRFTELTVDIDDDPLTALEMAMPAAGGKDFYRVNLTGNGIVDLNALADAFPQFPNLVLRDRTEPPLDIWADADEDSLEGIYFAMLKKTMENTPDQADRVRLAAEISRKLLSGREVTL